MKYGSLIRRGLFIMLVVWGLSFIAIEGVILSGSTPAQNPEASYVVVLGAAVHGDKVSLALKSRLDKAREYLDRYPQAAAVLSGGQGPKENLAEAEAMKRYLIASGVSGGRLLVEDRSTSTSENFKDTKRLLQEKGVWRDGMRIAVVTNDFHVSRADRLAKSYGFKPLSYPASTPAQVRVNCYLREYFAYMKSLVMD